MKGSDSSKISRRAPQRRSQFFTRVGEHCLEAAPGGTQTLEAPLPKPAWCKNKQPFLLERTLGSQDSVELEAPGGGGMEGGV